MNKRKMILCAMLFFFGISQAQTTDVAPDKKSWKLIRKRWWRDRMG